MKGLGFKITKIWAFVAEHGDDDEGIIAFEHQGTMYPMIAADQKRLVDFKPIAKNFSDKLNIKVKCVEFTTRQEIETYEPDQ